MSALITHVFQYRKTSRSTTTRTVYIYWTHLSTCRRRMNLDQDDRSSGYGSSSGICGPYAPSAASSASSPHISIFSDTLSAQSSTASSVSDDFRCAQLEEVKYQETPCGQAQLQYQAPHGLSQNEEGPVLDSVLRSSFPCPTYAAVTSVPVPQRQHPRRCSVSRNQKPPPLVRQRDRKINFVDNLVGKHVHRYAETSNEC